MHLMQRAPPAHWKHFDSTLGPFSRAIAFSIPDPASCNAINVSKFKHKQLHYVQHNVFPYLQPVACVKQQ